ncbi:putative transcription factor B3-Domain family [Dioscorea sansibarensis]
MYAWHFLNILFFNYLYVSRDRLSYSTLCVQSVPSRFASQHIKHRKQIVRLCVPKRNKEWHVRYVSNGGSWGFTAQQWQLFVFDNKLEEGDACVFELIASESEVVMHVHIFRVVAKVTTAVKEET